MGHDRSGLDRLLPRHPINVDVPIAWDIRRVRRLVGRSREVSDAARLLNLSLEGALIEVPLPSGRAPGDRVAIAMGNDRRGWVEIRHARVAKSGDRMLYGVRFVDSTALTGTVIHLVATARGTNKELLELWNHTR